MESQREKVAHPLVSIKMSYKAFFDDLDTALYDTEIVKDLSKYSPSKTQRALAIRLVLDAASVYVMADIMEENNAK